VTGKKLPVGTAAAGGPDDKRRLARLRDPRRYPERRHRPLSGAVLPQSVPPVTSARTNPS
jgi:hypothetical protein